MSAPAVGPRQMRRARQRRARLRQGTLALAAVLVAALLGAGSAVAPRAAAPPRAGLAAAPTQDGVAETPPAAAVPVAQPPAAEEPVRVQVLNGVGDPGAGEDVVEALPADGYRIVLSDNAASFDFSETQILVYGEDEAALATARAVRDHLGVGTIAYSRQPQSVVDVTVVVGKDLRRS